MTTSKTGFYLVFTTHQMTYQTSIKTHEIAYGAFKVSIIILELDSSLSFRKDKQATTA